MKSVFVDTSYFFAIMSPQDVAHEAAARWSREATDPLLTTFKQSKAHSLRWRRAAP